MILICDAIDRRKLCIVSDSRDDAVGRVSSATLKKWSRNLGVTAKEINKFCDVDPVSEELLSLKTTF